MQFVMNTIVHTISLWAIFGGAFAAETESEAKFPDTVPGPIPAHVVKVIDGDTVRVRAHIWLGQEVETNVRLAGVDAPERHSRCAREREMAETARAFVEDRLADGAVTLGAIDHDKYGSRVVARLFLPDGKDLSQALLSAGLVHPYEGGRKARWCSAAEMAAD